MLPTTSAVISRRSTKQLGCLLGAVLLSATACLTLPDPVGQRIQAKFELFQTYPPATQMRLRQGRVEIGDTRDMAWIALGAPRRTLQRRTASATTEVWSYTAEDTRQRTTPVEGSSVRFRRGSGHPYGSDTMWVETTETTEYERLRVEFAGNNVVAVENLTPQLP